MIGLTFIHPDWCDVGDFLEKEGGRVGQFQKREVGDGRGLIVRYDRVDEGGGAQARKVGFCFCCLSVS